MKNAIQKCTLAVYSATALAALTIGLAAPASAVAQYGGVPQDCSVHVNYQGSDVDVNWC